MQGSGSKLNRTKKDFRGSDDSQGEDIGSQSDIDSYGDEGPYDDEEGRTGVHDHIYQSTKQPSVNDPKLWQVRVKRNHERIAVMALINKAIDFNRRGYPLSILSVTSSDTTEGYVFVEAFKETHVR